MAMYAHAAPAQQSDTGKTGYTRAVLDFKNCEKPVWPERALQAQNTGAVTRASIWETLEITYAPRDADVASGNRIQAGGLG
jgi:hypothetical protein